MTVTPIPEEEPRCACGARLTEQACSGRRNDRQHKQCRKCRARARWQRREQARNRQAAGRRMRRA